MVMNDETILTFWHRQYGGGVALLFSSFLLLEVEFERGNDS